MSTIFKSYIETYGELPCLYQGGLNQNSLFYTKSRSCKNRTDWFPLIQIGQQISKELSNSF